MEGEDDLPVVGRPTRPSFAEDVYGPKKDEEKVELCESSLAQRRSANLGKLKELREVVAASANPTLNFPDKKDFEKDEHDFSFTYDDCDTYQNELAELYAYAEMSEYANNAIAFKTIAEENGGSTLFSSLSRSQQKAFVSDVLSRFESADSDVRLRSCRALLYILQGAYLDFVDEDEEPKKSIAASRGTGYHEVDCLIATVNMAYLSFEAGAYQALCGLLRTELEVPYDGAHDEESGRESKASGQSNSRSASNMDLSENERRCRRSATLSDNESLRVVLSCLYHMVEAIRRHELIERVVATNERRATLAAIRKRFLAELEEPLEQMGSSPLIIVLFDMCPPFYNGDAPHFPMRKVMLLIWKLIVAQLGGWEELREKKAQQRAKEGLSPIEDTLQVAASLKASLVRDQETAPGRARPRIRLAMSRQLACTGEEGVDDIEGITDSSDDEKTLTGSSGSTTPTFQMSSASSQSSRDEESGERTPTADSPSPLSTKAHEPTWKPKCRIEDLEAFIQNARQKFFQYELPGDTTSLFGLPPPIHSSVQTLRKHLYTSLSDVQMKREEDLNRYSFSMKEKFDDSSVEQLYRMMLPNISQYMIALIKVLLAAAPSNKAKSDALNILCDVLTRETESSDVLSNSISIDNSTNTPLEDSLTLTIDIYRHKEVMVKSTSAILLLLLKHFRLNHVYQFEFLAQHISLGNGVPLILKFLDQNMTRYMQSRHELHPYNFPQAAIFFVRNGSWPVLSAENVEAVTQDGIAYSLWRNVFSSINLLRILNKITKWKDARTMLLVVFKSAPILKRCLKIRLAVFQVYVLKLLKMQSRYLGRQWRRCNMDVISSIYSKVRHRLGDDWAYANETRTKSWHFRNIEADLKTAVEKFNARRYGGIYPAFRLEESDEGKDEVLGPVIDRRPVDNSAQSLLGHKRELGEKFKHNYELWMEAEVIKGKIDWDLLLDNSKGITA